LEERRAHGGEDISWSRRYVIEERIFHGGEDFMGKRISRRREIIL
jgi:hypothetical protein